jgi:hypothetical protein
MNFVSHAYRYRSFDLSYLKYRMWRRCVGSGIKMLVDFLLAVSRSTAYEHGRYRRDGWAK